MGVFHHEAFKKLHQACKSIAKCPMKDKKCKVKTLHSNLLPPIPGNKKARVSTSCCALTLAHAGRVVLKAGCTLLTLPKRAVLPLQRTEGTTSLCCGHPSGAALQLGSVCVCCCSPYVLYHLARCSHSSRVQDHCQCVIFFCLMKDTSPGQVPKAHGPCSPSYKASRARVRAALPEHHQGSTSSAHWGHRSTRSPALLMGGCHLQHHPALHGHATRVQAVGRMGPEYFYPLHMCMSHSFVSLQY